MNYIEQNKLQHEKDLVRVKHTLEGLNTYWLQRPYLRLGQIVSNSWHSLPEYKQNPEPEIQDVFYMSDEKFLTGLQKLEDNERKSKESSQS